MNKEEIEKIKQYYAITKEDFLKMCMQAREDTFKNHFPNQFQTAAPLLLKSIHLAFLISHK